MKNPRDFLRLNYTGFIIILACILGGGTAQGLWTDAIISVAMLPLAVAGTMQLLENRWSNSARILFAVICAFLLLQFLPFSHQTTLPEAPSTIDPVGMWTLSPGRSLRSVLFLLPAMGLALFVATLRDDQQDRLLSFIQLGLVLNLMVAAIQLSFSGTAREQGYLPFEVSVGIFANENHFSTFAFLAIPLLAYQNLEARMRPLVYLAAIAFILIILFAIGSRAGMAISTFLAIFCLVWFLDKPAVRKLRLPVLGAFLTALALMIGYASWSGMIVDFGRATIFENTWNAARDHWLTGTGLGTFAIAYPYYEPLSDIEAAFAYHAHNDYLELFLEGGIGAIILVAAFALMMISRMGATPLKQAAGLALLSVMLHSLVDYPLRTYAIMTVFAVLSAIIFSRPMRTTAHSGQHDYPSFRGYRDESIPSLGHYQKHG